MAANTSSQASIWSFCSSHQCLSYPQLFDQIIISTEHYLKYTHCIKGNLKVIFPLEQILQYLHIFRQKLRLMLLPNNLIPANFQPLLMHNPQGCIYVIQCQEGKYKVNIIWHQTQINVVQQNRVYSSKKITKKNIKL